MRKVLLLYIAILLIGCLSNKESTPKVEEYDFEALRDTLGLDSSCVFVEECSPLYTSDAHYSKPEERLKTLYYKIIDDETTDYIDTIVYAVFYDNNTLFWGRNYETYYAKDLIEWTINNRDKNL